MIAGLLSSLIIDIGSLVRASSPVNQLETPGGTTREPGQVGERWEERDISMAMERRVGRKGEAALIPDGPVFENSW